jgi:phosphomannomutase
VRKPIKFGTDGWRGVIADDFTFDGVRRVGSAIAGYLKSEESDGESFLVGYDKRFLSERYAEALAEVVSAEGIPTIISSKAVPTPVVSYEIVRRKMRGGAVITASHNPWMFNGVKFKPHFGGSASPETTAKIEKLIEDGPEAFGKGEYKCDEIAGPYIQEMKKKVDVSKSRLRIVADPMHGATGNMVEDVLSSTMIEVKTIRSERDAYFGGTSPEPIGKNLQLLSETVRKGEFDLGVATDGDGDRLGAVDENGKVLTTQEIFSLLFYHLVANKEWEGSVVKTISSTFMIDKIARDFGRKVDSTPVGFKHICELMLRKDVVIGGEESGGVGFKNHIPERDGLVGILYLLELITNEGKNIRVVLDELHRRYGKLYYHRLDLTLSEEKAAKLRSEALLQPADELIGRRVESVEDFDGLKMILGNGDWLLLRLSGTEPLVRIYAEAHAEDDVPRLLDEGKRMAGLV